LGEEAAIAEISSAIEKKREGRRWRKMGILSFPLASRQAGRAISYTLSNW
jgi:hypothetical protein